MYCLIRTITLIIVFGNNIIAARLSDGDVNTRKKLAAADSQELGEQRQNDVLLSGDNMLLANERKLNKSHIQRLVNERRQWITSYSLTGSRSIRRRMKRKIVRFETVPERKWRLPIKFKIDVGTSGKTAVAIKRSCSCMQILLHCWL